MVKNSVTKSKRAKSKALRILMLVGYSSGASGVWQRCKDEAIEFSRRGHQVTIYSSNAIKGKSGEAKEFDSLSGEGYHVNIKRFDYLKLGGESYMTWDFGNDAIDYNPQIIIAHSYRHTHSDKTIKIAQQLKNCKAICVTHAPFVHNRGILAKTVVAIKDYFSNIDQFDKVIAISRWEIPIIKGLGSGVFPQQIKRIPNPIFDRYFEGPINPGEGILYLGRMAPIKDLKTLVKGIGESRNFTTADFVGGGDEPNVDEVNSMVNIKHYAPVYDIDKKIEIFDNHEIFVLPSLREAMPIALVEAMARGKIVVASRTEGAMELIRNNRNGFLFKIGDYEELGKILDAISQMPKKLKQQIRREARASVDEFRMSRVMKKWNQVLEKI